MRRVITMLAAAMMLFPALPAAAETLVIPGSGSAQSLLRDLAAEFNRANPGTLVEIPDSIGTGGGMKAAGEGIARIARVGRRPGAKEAAFGLEYRVYALQPVVFATHPDINLKSLTRAHTRDLFSGKVTNWKTLGGPDLPVVVIGRDPGETNYELIRATFEEWKGLTMSPAAVIAKSDQEVVELIATRAGAVGFNVITEVLNGGLSPLALGPQVYTEMTYPLLIEAVFVFKPGAVTGEVKAFLDLVFSPTGARIIKAANAFPFRRNQ